MLSPAIGSRVRESTGGECGDQAFEASSPRGFQQHPRKSEIVFDDEQDLVPRLDRVAIVLRFIEREGLLLRCHWRLFRARQTIGRQLHTAPEKQVVQLYVRRFGQGDDFRCRALASRA